MHLGPCTISLYSYPVSTKVISQLTWRFTSLSLSLSLSPVKFSLIWTSSAPLSLPVCLKAFVIHEKSVENDFQLSQALLHFCLVLQLYFLQLGHPLQVLLLSLEDWKMNQTKIHLFGWPLITVIHIDQQNSRTNSLKKKLSWLLFANKQNNPAEIITNYPKLKFLLNLLSLKNLFYVKTKLEMLIIIKIIRLFECYYIFNK